MDTAVLDLLIVCFTTTALILVGGIGLWALPWTDEALDETTDAFVAAREFAIAAWVRFRRPPARPTPLRPPAFRPPVSLAAPLFREESTVP